MITHTHAGIPCYTKNCCLLPIDSVQHERDAEERLSIELKRLEAAQKSIQDLECGEEQDQTSTPPGSVGPSARVYNEDPGPISIQDIRMWAIEQVLDSPYDTREEFYDAVKRMVKYVLTGESE